MLREAKIALVTVGTDGNVDFVQTSDGQKFNLGPVSVLRFISKLVPLRTAKAALKEFVENKQVLLSVDLNKMWDLLPFQRARFSFDKAFIIKDCCRTNLPLENLDMMKTASFETFMTNAELAEDIIAKVAATDETIDRLVSEGKNFNVAAAKNDLHKIASKVAEIAQNVDLATPWVNNDLTHLSQTANEIHKIFHPEK